MQTLATIVRENIRKLTVSVTKLIAASRPIVSIGLGLPLSRAAGIAARGRLIVLLIAVFACLQGRALAASPSPSASELCDYAAARAAEETGVPLDVLRAIALTETGRTKTGSFKPWPWTVNMEGRGYWFDTRTEALNYVDNQYLRGARSFDVGCFQINYYWHGHAFRSRQEMFDPIESARYAARFLSDLHSEFGDWSLAAGAYHSRTPKFAARYRERFDRIRGRLSPWRRQSNKPISAPLAMSAQGPEPRQNGFPLLQSQAGQRTPGSLVPLRANPTGRRLFAVPENG